MSASKSTQALTLLPNLAALAALAAAVLGMSACERMTPEPETRVVLQATGTYADLDAVLLVSQGTLGLVVSARERGTDRVLAEGFVFDERMSRVMQDLKGPLESSLEGHVLHAGQAGEAKRRVTRITCAPKVPCATEGELAFEGSRWLSYGGGSVERGVSGRVEFALKKPDGVVVGLFSGNTDTQMRDSRTGEVVGGRVAVASEVKGKIHLDGNAQGEASLTLVPEGAVVVRSGALRETFRFDPSSDLLIRANDTELVSRDERKVVIRDRFAAAISLNRAELDDETPIQASAHGDVRYDVRVTVERGRLTVEGSSMADATLHVGEADGARKASFWGGTHKFKTVLDW